jgi:hypothetical protein
MGVIDPKLGEVLPAGRRRLQLAHDLTWVDAGLRTGLERLVPRHVGHEANGVGDQSERGDPQHGPRPPAASLRLREARSQGSA